MKRLAILVLAAAALLAGCGGDDGPGGGEPGKPVALKVGVLPIADVAPVYLGIDKGFYREENLAIEPQVAAGGAAIVPSVVSGDFQFGFSNIVSPIIAGGKGLPIQIIAAGSQAGDDDSKVLVNEDSPIRGPKDLEGKKIAVNTLNNIGTVTLNNTLEKEGVDISTLQFVEIDFPDMQAALEADRVDAIWEKEPFITRAEEAGAREIINPYTSTAARLAVGVYFSSRRYIEQNRDVVDRFVRATKRSLEFAESNPGEVRRIITESTQTPPEVAKVMDLPHWSSELNPRHTRLLTDLTVKYGLVDEKPDLTELIYEGGT